MKILIADDDPQILRALRITLSARGYDVVTASDGREALRLAADAHPDIIVLDLGMPGLTGIEVIEGVRGWSAVPILVVSGRSDSLDKVLALDAGADDTSPNRSPPTSCWRASAPSRDAHRARRMNRSSASATSP